MKFIHFSTIEKISILSLFWKFSNSHYKWFAVICARVVTDNRIWIAAGLYYSYIKFTFCIHNTPTHTRFHQWQCYALRDSIIICMNSLLTVHIQSMCILTDDKNKAASNLKPFWDFPKYILHFYQLLTSSPKRTYSKHFTHFFFCFWFFVASVNQSTQYNAHTRNA